MEKRYQVFISSTFKDLKEERKEVMEAIINLDCFPAGMEMFPAASVEQFEYIKPIIDKSDYYVLIIAGKYGSVADDGISYTEKEYDYAKEKGIPVLVFVRKDINNIPVNKTDNNPELRIKLDQFREKVMRNTLAKFWDTALELKYIVHDSLIKAFTISPRIGWIRGNIENNEQLLQQLNSARKEYDQLKKELEEYRTKLVNNSIIEKLSSGEEKTKLKYMYRNDKIQFIEFTWNEIFYVFGKTIYIGDSATDEQLKLELRSVIASKSNTINFFLSVSEDEIIRLAIQLEKLNLIKKILGKSEFVFTEHGKEEFDNKLIEKKEN